MATIAEEEVSPSCYTSVVEISKHAVLNVENVIKACLHISILPFNGSLSFNMAEQLQTKCRESYVFLCLLPRRVNFANLHGAFMKFTWYWKGWHRLFIHRS